MKAVVGRRQLVRSMAYVIKTENTEGESSFFEALRQAGMELRVKDLQIYPDGTKKGDWDVGLAVDAMRMAPTLDVIVLVTGDGDFVPLVEYLKLEWARRSKSRLSAGRLRENSKKPPTPSSKWNTFPGRFCG